MNFQMSMFVVSVSLMSAAVAEARVDQSLRFLIEPGSKYTYYPSGESLGIPGCEPNAYQCDFEIAGSFTLDILVGRGLAEIVDVDLTFAGNDAVEVDWPEFGTVEHAVRWLENHQYVALPPIAE